MQGGLCALPLPAFPTGIMRGRFHRTDGNLYACGLFAWAGDRTQSGGLYRIRATGKPIQLPVGLSAHAGNLAITFTAALDRVSATNSANYAAEIWSLRRTEKYGSQHYDERPVRIMRASLSGDARTVTLTIPDLQPTQGMKVEYHLRDPGGQPVQGVIHNTIHRLAEPEP